MGLGKRNMYKNDEEVNFPKRQNFLEDTGGNKHKIIKYCFVHLYSNKLYIL